MQKEKIELKLKTPLKALKCKHCGYEWVPRKPNPKECPFCKNRAWEGGRNK